tara:strand:+ start:175 stop:306 length:132 start_codon:yes stop_codon:yes gene_type:complete
LSGTVIRSRQNDFSTFKYLAIENVQGALEFVVAGSTGIGSLIV